MSNSMSVILMTSGGVHVETTNIVAVGLFASS
jgi:hypothetical protein